MWDKAYIEKLEGCRARALAGGGQERIDAQHRKNKLTARERLEILFDPQSFTEVGAMVESRIDDFGADKKRVPGDGVVTGYGKINGRLVFASSEDFTVFGGTLGEAHSMKICRMLDMALEMRAPVVMLNDSGGARIEEGICALAGYAGIFRRNTAASGIIPQIAVIMGPCAGGACYSPAICDFVFMVRQTGMMFITGPQVVRAVTGQRIDQQELGGADMHTRRSGAVHFSYDDDRSCLLAVRKLLAYLPQNSGESAPVMEGEPNDLCRGLQQMVSDNQRKCYDVKAVIGAMVDKHSFFEVHKEFAPNAVTGFARLNGDTVGFAANQPNCLGGSLDVNASDKLARFVRFCDAFHIPIVTLVDVPGYMPGSEQEQGGIIRHGAKVLYAYAEASVPKVTVILRKAYGGAYIAMNSKELGADIVYAWPIAEIAVMGAEGAVDIIFRKQIAAAGDDSEVRDQHIQAYKEKFMNPYIAAARGFVDEVIRPEETREKLAAALEMLKGKRRAACTHGNIPL